jgi:phosphoribosylformylglycinamidine synthase
VLGVWSVHGEGRAHFGHGEVYDKLLQGNQAPIRFVTDDGEIALTYPCNPSASPLGIAAMCSPDGRHLAIMVRQPVCVCVCLSLTD